MINHLNLLNSSRQNYNNFFILLNIKVISTFLSNSLSIF